MVPSGRFTNHLAFRSRGHSDDNPRSLGVHHINSRWSILILEIINLSSHSLGIARGGPLHLQWKQPDSGGRGVLRHGQPYNINVASRFARRGHVEIEPIVTGRDEQRGIVARAALVDRGLERDRTIVHARGVCAITHDIDREAQPVLDES